jgi:hypothetical protein
MQNPLHSLSERPVPANPKLELQPRRLHFASRQGYERNEDSNPLQRQKLSVDDVVGLRDLLQVGNLTLEKVIETDENGNDVTTKANCARMNVA